MSESGKMTGQAMIDQMLNQMSKNVEEAQNSWRRAAEVMMPKGWQGQTMPGQEIGQNMGKAMERFQSEFAAQMEANRTLAASMAEVAQKQQALMMELAQSLQTTLPTGDNKGEGPSVRIRPEKVDDVFEKAIDLVQTVGDTMVTTQVEALNMLRRYAAQGTNAANEVTESLSESMPGHDQPHPTGG